MDAPTESSLISKLETSDYDHIHHLFSTYLHPFTDLITNKSKTHSDPSLVRPLAKKYLPFLSRALSILPKRLSETPKPDAKLQEPILELFDTYKLCLQCLECISSQLSGKPYSVYFQRVRMIHCFEACGRYKDAEIEGFTVLEGLRRLKSGKTRGRLVPELEKDGGDCELGLLVVEIVVTLVKCACMSESKEDGSYRRVLRLVDEVRPWFRGLDANAYEKLHRVLVTYLSKCTLLLVGELTCFDGDLVRAFCSATLTEYAKSSMKDQIQKFARRICSSLFSQQGNRSSLVIDLLNCVLDSIACECKIEIENTMTDFLEIVSYCADKCRNASTDLCIAVATHLNKIAADFRQVLAPYDLILRIYAIGLYFTNCNVQSGDGDSTTLTSTKDEFAIRFFFDKGDSRLQHLAALLGSLESYFHIGSKENSASFHAEYRDSVGRIRSHMESDYKASIARQKNKKDHPLFYFNALKFLCQPLADLVNSARKQILAEDEGAPFSTELCAIQDAFLLFFDVFLLCQSCTFERERDRFDENNKMVLSVAVATFTLSFRTKINMQKSVNFIKHVISNGRLQPQGLKFLFVSLYNVGVILYRNKQVKEASKALKLCCRASWACVLLLCQMFEEKSKGFHGDLSEAAIVDFVTEACTKSAFLLDVLHQCASHKVKRIILDSLENWSVAGNLFKRLPSPIPLVKQWVKIGCKLSKDADVEDCAPTLYCLLSSSTKVSKRTVGILLEQELLVYEKMNAKYPKLCQRMQMKIIDFLLQDVYVTKDSCLQKSRIFIRKGRALRAHGIECLKDCIQCLSEAISTINDMYGEICSRGYPVSHQLAVAYCLRALCTQEADSNSKRVFQDIHAALNLWLSVHIPDHCSADDRCDMVSEMMLLLYHIFDLLSIKGHMKFHHDIYKLMIRLFKWKTVSLEKSLAMLWGSRRLSHALCASPVNEAFIMNLSEHCGKLSNSIDFWTSCLRGSPLLLVGFQQHFSYHHGSSFQSHITVDKVKEVALDLISSVSVSSHSVFLAGYLYYDLCERLISNGRLIEALSYAKEAHRLRSKLLQEKFTYSMGQQNENYNESGEIIEKCTYGLSNLQMFSSVATEVWSCDTISWDLEGCILTPWNVLQCYLESTLQVGTIHEIIGNGVEAEFLLLWGKNISCSQGLPLFSAAFSSVLGKLYRKKWLWDLAEKELRNAKQIVVDSSTDISCLKCRLILEVTIDQQLGDLSRSHSDSCTGNPSIGRLSYAENLYKSALDKLNLPEWKNSISSPEEASADSMMLRNTLVEEVKYGASNTFAHCATDQSDVIEFFSKGDGPEAKMEAKKSRKAKKASKPLQQEQYSIPEHNLRITRSRSRCSQNNNVSILGEVQIGLAKYSNSNRVSACADTFSQKRLLLEVKNSTVDFGCEVTCVCNKMKCWQCLPVEVMESGLVNNFIHMKWEFVRRRLSLRLLTGIGKCLGVRGEIHETHELFLQSISVLVSRNPFSHMYSSTSLLDLIGKEIPGDVLAVERATILYNICWFALKSYHLKDTRIICCDLSQIQMPRIVSWLLLAFILCREVPVLFQKVSRLLAAIYVLSATSEPFSFSLSSCKALSESHWASYFHQASIGTHLNQQLLSSMAGKCHAQNLMNVQGSCVTGSTCIGTETFDILRLVPESLQDLDKFVTNFFWGLPSAAVICISMLGGAFGSLLRELLLYPSSVHAWMLLSRMNLKSQPVVILLPVDSVLEEASDDDSTNSGSGILFEDKDLGKQWHCPWGSTVVDDVVPVFKLILEENYLSSSIFPFEDTKRNRSLWWMRRKKLDQRLGKLLRDLEDSWLGPWKYLLWGEWSDCRRLDSIQKKLVHDLKCKCKVDVNESLLKVILGGARYAYEKEECVPQLFLDEGCYIGRVRYHDGERCETLSDTCDGVESLSGLAFQLILEAANELEEEECVKREPIILVLDCDVQMLPWENIPILRNQEVYRMPSVGSIAVTLDRSRQHQEQVGRIVTAFPLIDPLDAFYLLNPGGDLRNTQVEFENWFKDQKLEGKAGTAPTIEELAIALKSHDLFIYFGHGSGAQYIPGHEIQKLENCAATLLMGCSSGSLSLNGSYTPQGTPLSYLLAGSPVIVANLWEVTDKDIDRFGKAMLDAWLRERLTPPSGCAQCNIVAKEFKSMSIRGTEGNAKKKVPRKKLPKACDSSTCKDFCDHRPKIGSFVGQAREACTLPFLIGAAPVCYGVPTGIKKRTDL